MERRSTYSRELRFWERNRLQGWEIVALFFWGLLMAGGVMLTWHQDDVARHHRVTVDYWDAHGCINHLDGSHYEATADKLEEFNPQDICKEYVHVER